MWQMDSVKQTCKAAMQTCKKATALCLELPVIIAFVVLRAYALLLGKLIAAFYGALPRTVSTLISSLLGSPFAGDRPTLIALPYSHFCEKARWALDLSSTRERQYQEYCERCCDVLDCRTFLQCSAGSLVSLLGDLLDVIRQQQQYTAIHHVQTRRPHR